MFGTEPAKEIEMAVNRIIEAANSFFNIGIPPFLECYFSLAPISYVVPTTPSELSFSVIYVYMR
jgi:hypothetical protein